MKKRLPFFLILFLLISPYPNIPISSAHANELYFLHSDHLGSTRVVTDKQGNKVMSFDYYPYGSLINEIPTESRSRSHRGLSTQSEGSSTQSVGTIERLYTSQIQDASSNLYFYNARYYNPQTAHFISADPIQGPNRYAYVSGNPINITDPSGNATPVRVPRKTPTGWGSGGGGGGVGGYSDAGFNLFEAMFGSPSNWLPSLCGGNVACMAQHAASSIAYGTIGWDPFGVLSHEERAEIQVGTAVTGLLGTLSAPTSLPRATEVAEELMNLPSKWRPKGISPNRAQWASQHALKLFEEDEAMQLLTQGKINEARAAIEEAGLPIKIVKEGQLSKMFGTRPTNLATIQGGVLYMEKQVLSMSQSAQAMEFAHEYAARVFENIFSLGREHPAFGAATRAVDVIMGKVYSGPY